MNEIDALIRLADASWREFDARRSYEWKLSFGLWTWLGALSGILLKGGSTLIGGHPIAAVALPAMCLLGILGVDVLVWTRGIHRRDHRDLRRAHGYWNLAEVRLGVNPPMHVVLSEAEAPPLLDWFHGTQVAITCLLVAIALLSLVLNVLPM